MTNGEKLDLLLVKMDAVESKMDTVESKMDSMESKMDTVESKMGTVESKMDSMESRMDLMESKIDRIDQDVNGIKLTIENEIRVNIQRVAEGHMDLSRKLNEALQKKDELEMLTVRVNVLESDVRDIKRKIS